MKVFLKLQLNRLTVMALTFASLALVSLPLPACTIFVLTDANRALFCNNEDWSNPKPRIWFLPAGDGYHGAVYVGFDDGSAQGGLNTAGLACDAVGGYTEQWNPNPNLPDVRGNPGQRMLETCATVNDAIAFFRSHYTPSFRRSKILVADRTGASAVIGARDGRLVAEPDNQCRGFGFGHRTLEAALAKRPEPIVANGFKILRDCRQGGPYATKYSNIYDLKNGDIFLYPVPGGDDEVRLNLAAELAKGAHYYEMPQIQEQLTQAPRPLPLRMKRFPLDEFKPIPDQEPEVTAHLRAMLLDMAAANPQAEDYTAEAWKKLSSKQQEIQDSMKFLGDFISLTLVQRREEQGQRDYFYRLEFTNAAVLQHFFLDAQNKLVSSESEGAELKRGAIVPEVPSVPVGGIGISLRVEGDNIFVEEIMPDTPAAAQTELHAGDQIIAVAQDAGPAVPVHADKLAEAIEFMHGHIGTTVRLTIVPAGTDEAHVRVVSFVREKLKMALH